MSDEIRVLGQMCKALCSMQDTTWSRNQKIWEDNSKINSDTYNTYEELISRFAPLTEKEIDTLFSSSKSVSFNLSNKRKAIYLSPTSGQPKFVPVISLECNMNDAEALIKIRIMLIQKKDEVLKGIGFRFEKGENDHNYYHAQLIEELQGVKHVPNPTVEYLGWLPEKEPAIPVKANNTITLLLCSLISLYGLRTCFKLITDFQLTELTNYLNFFAESIDETKRKKKK